MYSYIDFFIPKPAICWISWAFFFKRSMACSTHVIMSKRPTILTCSSTTYKSDGCEFGRTEKYFGRLNTSALGLLQFGVSVLNHYLSARWGNKRVNSVVQITSVQLNSERARSDSIRFSSVRRIELSLTGRHRISFCSINSKASKALSFKVTTTGRGVITSPTDVLFGGLSSAITRLRYSHTHT